MKSQVRFQGGVGKDLMSVVMLIGMLYWCGTGTDCFHNSISAFIESSKVQSV